MPLHAGPRHPLCPSCGYDLVATTRRGGRVCSECGCEFELHELKREVRPGEWTESVGVRRLALSLCIRSLFSVAIWSCWLLVLSLLSLNSVVHGLGVLAITVLLGVIMGQVLWRGLRDRCGFDGPLPAAAAVFALISVLTAGAVIGQITGVGAIGIGILTLAAGTASLLIIVPQAILD